MNLPTPEERPITIDDVAKRIAYLKSDFSSVTTTYDLCEGDRRLEQLRVESETRDVSADLTQLMKDIHRT